MRSSATLKMFLILGKNWWSSPLGTLGTNDFPYLLISSFILITNFSVSVHKNYSKNTHSLYKDNSLEKEGFVKNYSIYTDYRPFHTILLSCHIKVPEIRVIDVVIKIILSHCFLPNVHRLGFFKKSFFCDN